MILIFLNVEPDYLTRVGLTNLDFLKKKLLLKHFLEKLLSIKFIIPFITITILYFFLKVKPFQMKGKLLYFIFLGSFLGPIFFIIISFIIGERANFINILLNFIK